MRALREYGFVRRLEPTECHMYRDGQQYLCYCCVVLSPLRHRWMSAGGGSPPGIRVSICVSPGARRVSHVSRRAAVLLILLVVLSTIAAPVDVCTSAGAVPQFHTPPSSDTAMTRQLSGVRVGVCASPEVQRVSHLSLWAAVLHRGCAWHLTKGDGCKEKG